MVVMLTYITVAGKEGHLYVVPATNLMLLAVFRAKYLPCPTSCLVEALVIAPADNLMDRTKLKTALGHFLIVLGTTTAAYVTVH